MVLRGGRRAGALFFLFLGWWSRPAWADPSGASVQVDCPALGEERRAALESRAKTELLVRRESGTLVVVCRPDGVQLRWQSAAGRASEHSIPLAADAIATEEQILEALEILLNPPEPAPPVAAPASPQQPTPKPRPPPRPEPPAPAMQPAPVPAVEKAEASRTHFELLAGATAELWSSEVGGAVGPGARAIWALPSGFALSGGAVVAWTLKSPEEVNARTVRLHAGGEYHVDSARRWRIGASVLIDFLHANRDAGGVEETADERILGASLRAQYALSSPPFVVVLGPTLSVRTAQVDVQVGRREIFSIPVVAPGLTAELGVGPL